MHDPTSTRSHRWVRDTQFEPGYLAPMAIRRLPDSLRGRTGAVTLWEALPALIVTPVAGAVWLSWPFVATWFALHGGGQLRAAILMTISMLWAFWIVKEWKTVLGLVVAVPVSTWSVVQQLRGRISEDDLEQGRFVWIRDRYGVPEGEVVGECVCGCGARLILDGTGYRVLDDPACHPASR